jgi:hypothetical protein
MARLRIVFALLLSASLKPACGGGGDPTPFVPVSINAVLRGSQMVPVNGSAATGTASLVVNAFQTEIAWTVTQTGLVNITFVRVYAGAPGVNGASPILTLVTGSFVSPGTGTATVADFTPSAADSIFTFQDALHALASGNTYMTITTTGSPNGEIRGQLGATQVNAVSLSGAQQVGPVATTAAGSAVLTFNAAQTELRLTVTFVNVVNPTMGHIHAGKTGTNGGIILLFFMGGAFTSPFSATLTSANFTASPGDGVNSFADAVNAILSGNAYVNLHTVAQVNGEIRGQLGPVRLTTTLSGANEVPPSGSAGTGTGTITLNGAQNSVLVNVTYASLGSAVTASHVHAGTPATAGGTIIIDFAALGTASPIAGRINSISAATVESMVSGNSYINVHTTNFGGGEIRGQLAAP